MTKRKITNAQIERAIGVLGDVSANHENLSGRDRDAIGVVIEILDQLSQRGDFTYEVKQWT